VSAEQKQAERVLTLLDFWAQRVLANITLEQSRAQALRVGDLATAAKLERRARPSLLQAERFPAMAAHDATLRNRNSIDVRALTAAGIAWAKWASALLRQAADVEPHRGRDLAELEAKAIRLHQAAYAAVDATLRAALQAR
jgi:predicted transcriptional regulator